MPLFCDPAERRWQTSKRPRPRRLNFWRSRPPVAMSRWCCQRTITRISNCTRKVRTQSECLEARGAVPNSSLCCPQSRPLRDLFADHQLSPVTVVVNPLLTFFASLCGRPGHLSSCLTVCSVRLIRVGRQASRGISRLSRRAESRSGHRAGTATAAAIATVGERRSASSERPARTARLPGGAG